MKQAKIINRQTRIEWIDIAKGIGILCVLFGHFKVNESSIFGVNITIPYYLVYSFHMPLFFFLSGYCFSKKTICFKEFFLKKCIGLMIPYISFSIFWIVSDSLFNVLANNISFEFFLDEFKTYFMQIRFHAIWFLPCLFIMEIAFYWILRLAKGNNVLIFTIGIIITILGVLYRKVININLFWNVDIVFTMILFFIIGYILKSINFIKSESKHKNSIAFCVFALLNVTVNTININIFKPHIIDVYGNQYCNYILFYISALLGIMAIVELSIMLEGKAKYINYLGRNTLVYFALHQIIYYAAQKIFEYLNLSSVLIWILYFVLMVLSLIILTLLNEILLKTKFKILLGKGIKLKK